METSLRYSGVSKSLRIHAKQNIHLPFVPHSYIQVHGELDTKYGEPSHFSATFVHSYTKWLTSFGLGIHFDEPKKLQYTVSARKSFRVTSDGSATFNIKGRCDAVKDFTEMECNGAAEFLWSITGIQKDQDVRFKVGYDILDKVPYFQIRENNWSINADSKGRWNIKYNL